MLSLEEGEGMGSSGWKDRELGCYQWSRCENEHRSQIPGLEAESSSCCRNQGGGRGGGSVSEAWQLRRAVSAPRAQ